MMLVNELAQKLSLKPLSNCGGLREVKGVYTGDLLSWVMGKAKENDVWITVIGNINTVAVAVLTDVACVIISEGSIPDEPCITKAKSEGIALFASNDTSAQLAIKISAFI